MPAAVSITRVAGSRVSSAAVMMPLEHSPKCSMFPARDMAESEEEHAVSILTDGPESHQSLIALFITRI